MSVVISTLLLTSNCMADNSESLQSQIDGLKKEIASLQDNSDSIESELAKKDDTSVKMNGYMDAYYGIYSGDKNNGANDGFRIYRFSLIPNQQINKNLRWLAEIEFEDAPRRQPGNELTITGNNVEGLYGQIFLERSYMQYDLNPMLKIRLGRDFCHSTVWSDNHYPTFILPEARPLSERKIFPHVNDGIEILGNTLLGSIPFDYIAYYGNGNKYDGGSDVNSEDIVGARVRVQLPVGSFNRISFSGSTGGMTGADTAVTTPKNEQTNIGVSLEQKFAQFDLKAQYSQATVNNGNNKYDLTGYYANLSYTYEDFTPWAQYDIYNDKNTNTEDQRITLGLQYSVSSNLKLKIEHQLDTQKDTLTNADVAAKKGNATLLAAAIYF